MNANKLMALLGLEYPTTSRYKELHAVVTQALEDAQVEGANQENSLWKKHMAETEQPQPEPDDYAALLRHAREILVKTGTVDVPYEQLGAGFLNVGIAPRLARDLRVRFHRDEVNARMVFGTEA